MLKNEVVQTMSLNIKFSYLAENSKFSWSNSYFSILTPIFLRDGFLNSCFQNPSENSVIINIYMQKAGIFQAYAGSNGQDQPANMSSPIKVFYM